jgi:hypothetical protein
MPPESVFDWTIVSERPLLLEEAPQSVQPIACVSERSGFIITGDRSWRSDLMMKLAEESIVAITAPPTTVVPLAPGPGDRHEHDELVSELDALDLQSSFGP